MPFYRHRQSSLFIPAVMLVLVLAAIARALTAHHPVALAPLALLAAIFIALTFGFSSLTVEVGTDEIVWFFGHGVWRKRIDRRDVASAKVVRNPWWYDIGIHRTPHGWLYNVWGRDAVEIALTSGRRLRIGTDEPDALVAALARR
jgi:hypothetical protein